MGRAPCCDKANVKKGPWSPEEDKQLKDYIETHGTGGNWISLPQKAGLRRCGKSCRLRWLNYLRPNIKHGEFTDEEDRVIFSLYANIGSRWSIIAAQLPGRTDNDIKNYWNTKLKKKLMMGIANHSKSKIKPSTTYNKSPILPLSQPTYNTIMPNYYNAPSTFAGFDQPTLLDISSNTFVHNNYPVFGGAPEPSCSSSDGSYFYNGESSWIWEESTTTTAPLIDSGLEEIKQLISTSNGDFSNCGGGFYFDESKTGERAMLYY